MTSPAYTRADFQTDQEVRWCEDIHPNLRVDGSYFDFQFVGLAKSGDVIDRSQKIESLVKYTFDCP
jgi:hypothetical protein